MDHIDQLILAELQRDGRLTNAELADRVSLTASPCLRRVRHLEETGVITGYRAELNQRALGYGLEVFVSVSMRAEDKDTIADFEREVAGLSEVMEVHRLFGEPDFLLRIMIEDVAAYEQFYFRKLTNLPGIATMTSHTVMKQVKQDKGLPITANGHVPRRRW